MSFKGLHTVPVFSSLDLHLHTVPIFSSLDLHLKVFIYANNSLIPTNFYKVRLEETLSSSVD